MSLCYFVGLPLTSTLLFARTFGIPIAVCRKAKPDTFKDKAEHVDIYKLFDEHLKPDSSLMGAILDNLRAYMDEARQVPT